MAPASLLPELDSCGQSTQLALAGDALHLVQSTTPYPHNITTAPLISTKYLLPIKHLWQSRCPRKDAAQAFRGRQRHTSNDNLNTQDAVKGIDCTETRRTDKSLLCWEMNSTCVNREVAELCRGKRAGRCRRPGGVVVLSTRQIATFLW